MWRRTTTAHPSCKCGTSVTRTRLPRPCTGTRVAFWVCLGAPTTAPCSSRAARTRALCAGTPTLRPSCASCLPVPTGTSTCAGRLVSARKQDTIPYWCRTQQVFCSSSQSLVVTEVACFREAVMYLRVCIIGLLSSSSQPDAAHLGIHNALSFLQKSCAIESLGM